MPSPKTAPIRLPPLKALRVKATAKKEGNPCMTAMSTVLACWASLGYSTAGCAAVEQSLRACMDTTQVQTSQSNNLNHHLRRFQSRLTLREKRRGGKE
ncbi:40S ribosomal protein mrp10 [Sporothrix curviconia]|uniref:40S ribosomal protein mrp10 n=1 Tax=Sporothrix curviconia TaxID=1260050 RepID=A0ABP0B5D0_9PEZI